MVEKQMELLSHIVADDITERKSDMGNPSTKTCCHCGNVNPDVVLGQKKWICPHCGVSIDRDHNAAINIRDEGIRQFYSENQTA